MDSISEKPSPRRRLVRGFIPGDQVDLVLEESGGSELIHYPGVITYLVDGKGQASEVTGG